MTKAGRERPGLASERTALAWERTSFSLLTVGALLAFRGGNLPQIWRFAASVVAFGLALIVLVLGRRPSRQGPVRLVHDAPGRRRAVPFVGVSVAVFATAVALALML